MTTTLRAIAAVAALALAAPALAQQSPNQPRLGLGVSFNSTVLGVQPLVTDTAAFVRPKFYVPIFLAPNVRIEPEIGWLKTKNDNDSTTNSAFDLGVGAMILKAVNPAVDLYGGARLSLVWVKTEQIVGGGAFQRVEQRNFAFAPVFGGEYKPSPWFSVGVEAQLNLIFLGDEDVWTNGVKTTGSGGDAQTLEGLAFLRVYFL
jgi:hypothetical protein